MLAGHSSIATYNKSNIFIWMTMAFQAGLLNTGGFLACHSFVSHVTGYATLFGVSLKEKDIFYAMGLLAVPFLFLAGAMISGVLVDIRLKLNKKPRYYISFGVMFVLISIVFLGGITGYFGTFGEPLELSRDYTLLALLCLVCGIQNGMVTTVSKSVIRTTHLTGITTDLGIGIVRYLNKSKLPDDFVKNEANANMMRASIIIFFGFGCVLGAFLFTKIKYYGFLVPILTMGILLMKSLYYQLVKQRDQETSI